jgi:hypothetical protein
MSVLVNVAKGAIAGSLLKRLVGGDRRRRRGWGRRSAVAGRGFRGGSSLAAPIALGVGAWAWRRWRADREHDRTQWSRSAPATGGSAAPLAY